jgi:hypothetical protein
MLSVGILASVLVAGGCASTLSESQCLAGDWQTIGYRDGAEGWASTRLLDHQDACVKRGITPDRTSYMAGWREGVIAFCTPDNGFSEGERGAGYGRICPQELEPGFLAAYKDGRSLYLAGSEVDRLDQLLGSKQAELVGVNDRLVAIVSSIALDTDATAETRIGWVNESNNLAHARGRLEGEIESLGVELAVQRQRLTVTERRCLGKILRPEPDRSWNPTSAPSRPRSIDAPISPASSR